MFKILNLKADNYKVLEAIEINAAGQPVEIHGKNGRGKSTVLDCIQEAFAGKVAKKPIRNGEDSAKIVVEIGENKTQYIITRTFTEKGSYLKVENADGFKTTSPQKMLDELIGKISFDPLAFANMDPERQRKIILGICPELDVSDLDKKHRDIFVERTEINRQIKDVKGAIKEAESRDTDKELPDKEIDPVDVVKSRDEDLEHIKKLQNNIEEIEEDYNGKVENSKCAEERIESAKERLKTLEKAIKETKEIIAVEENALKNIVISPIEPLIGEISEKIAALKGRADKKTAQLEGLQAQNEAIRLRGQIKELNAKSATLDAQSNEKTERLESIEKEKKDRFKNASLPVSGLVLGPDGLYLNGNAFEDLATSDRLRVSFNIAMALNPRIRVVFIRDGSLLDPDSLAEIYRMAEANGFQVWVEVTTADEKIGFIIKE